MCDFIEMFCGVGGFRLGLEKTNQKCINSESRVRNQKRQSGELFEGGGIEERSASNSFRCVWANDNDKYACQIYRKNFGDKELVEADIKTIQADSIPDHMLLTAGFPCQAFSVAGKRKGFQDTRGTLFYHIARIIKAKRPPLLLLENVRGLLSAQEGYCFWRIIQTLDELGYNVEWQVLNSKYFGVPQNRERVFIVGHLRGASTRQVFPIGKTSQVANGGHPKEQVAQTLQSPEHACGNYKGMTMIVADRTRSYAKKGRNLESPKEMANILSSVQKDNLLMVLADNKGGNIRKRMRDAMNPSWCLGGSQTLITNKLSIRRLTPTECERLQGFPDGWTEGVSDTQRYKLLGNAVTVNVIQFLGNLLVYAKEKV